MSLLRTTSISLLVGFFALGLIPAGTFAATTSTVTVSVQDENGNSFSGSWYLHKGTTINGFLIRNGSGGETFEADTGSYYLEVRGIPGDHPYYYLHSDNPLYLDEGQTVVFNVQYFETEEDMLAASGNAPTPETPGETETVVTPDIFDAHGCNSTQQYVWCERSEACVTNWTPSCRVEENTEEEATGEEETLTVSIIDPLSYREVPDFNTPPVVSNPAVPTFETPPPTFTPEVPEAEAAAAMPFQLVQTGPSALFMLIPSMMIGLAVVRRKR